MTTPICPLMGRPCPGPNMCMPAVMSVRGDEGDEESELQCPILAVADGITSMAMQAVQSYHMTVQANTPPENPPDDRDKVLASLKLDQES